MQIIAGKLKGKKLLTLPTNETRPTLTRIKENIFNILQNYTDFQGLIVVDFFGGSGSLSLESLSRGAKQSYINDLNPKAIEIIKQNINNCNLIPSTSVSKMDYLSFLKTLKRKFNLLFIDPPFADTQCQKIIIDYCFQHQLLDDGALIVLETNILLDKLILEDSFKVVSDKKYGKIYIKILQYTNFN